VKNLGNATWLLGIHIEYNEDGITLSQTAYIEKLLRRYGMEKSNPVSTPMIENIKLLKGSIEKQIEDLSYYQSIIGSIMYAVIGTRFDLVFTITLLS
jgi:ribosomal protein L19